MVRSYKLVNKYTQYRVTHKAQLCTFKKVDSLKMILRPRIVKGTVIKFQVTLQANTRQCPIYNSTLETFIWSKMWKIVSSIIVGFLTRKVFNSNIINQVFCFSGNINIMKTTFLLYVLIVNKLFSYYKFTSN